LLQVEFIFSDNFGSLPMTDYYNSRNSAEFLELLQKYAIMLVFHKNNAFLKIEE